MGADMILRAIESVPTWLIDWDLVAVTGNETPPRNPNDDDNDEEEEEEDEEDEDVEPPVVREPDE
jgi:hypothetical protein